MSRLQGDGTPFWWTRDWTAGHADAHAALTGRDLPTRQEGQTPEAVSPYGSGNLGLNVQDDPEAEVTYRFVSPARFAASTLDWMAWVGPASIGSSMP